MRIGIASEWIGAGVGGPERHARRLIEALIRLDPDNRYRVIVTPDGKRELGAIDSDHVTVAASAFNSRWHYIPFGLPWEVMKNSVDVLHATFSFPPWCPTRKVVLTVHDVCATAHPEFFKPSIGLRVRWLLARGMSKACRVLVPTETTKREILEHYDLAPEKIRVIPYGVDQRFADADQSRPGDDSFGPSSDFILYVGRFHIRKNLERLVEAFSKLPSRRERGVKLVLAGRDFWNRDNVLSKIAELGLEDEVICPGHVSDAQLDTLYRRAKVFAFLSIHEGFGFPPLEAMARGLPVVAGRVSCMPEVLGDAAWYVDPYSSDAIAAGLERLLDDAELRDTLVSKGRERVEHFTWEESARRTLELYEEIHAEADA